MIPRRIGSDRAEKMSSSASPSAAEGSVLSRSGPRFNRPISSATYHRLPCSFGGRGVHFDDVPLQSVGNHQKLGLFARSDADAVQRGGNMRHEDVPFGLGDPHTLMGRPHIPPGIMHRSSERGAEEVDNQLISTPCAIVADAFPIHPKYG